MTKQYQITGVGPTNTMDGTVKLFTTLREPFIVTPEWLAAQPKHPALGDVLEVTGTVMTLVTEAQAETDAEDEQGDESGNQKKNPSSGDSSSGSELSPFREYHSRPVSVHAAEITALGKSESDNTIEATFRDGSTRKLKLEAPLLRTPQIGDYWLIEEWNGGIQEHVYSKEVFELNFTVAE